MPEPTINVIIPHYKCEDWLELCYKSIMLLSNRPFSVTIIDMGGKKPGRIDWRSDDLKTIYLDVGEKVGGAALPMALQAGIYAGENFDITVTVDPDAIVLKKGWDDDLRAIFADPRMAVAGINPRSDAREFFDVPEWNWMAFRTKFWFDHVKTFQWRRVDVGHLFSDAALANGMGVSTWPMRERPFAGRAASVVGRSEPWAFHAFYSTRKMKDRIPESERVGILTPEEENKAMAWCRAVIDSQVKGTQCPQFAS